MSFNKGEIYVYYCEQQFQPADSQWFNSNRSLMLRVIETVWRASRGMLITSGGMENSFKRVFVGYGMG